MNDEAQQPTEPQTSATPAIALKVGRNLFRERFFFFVLLAILAFLGLLLIWPNLTAILAALAIVVLIKPLYNWFLKKNWIRGKANRATVATIVTFLLLIAIPVILFVGIAYNQANALFTNPETGERITVESIVAGTELFLDELSAQGADGFDLDVLVVKAQEVGSAFSDWLSTLLVRIGVALSQFFVGAVIVLVIMMVLLPRFNMPPREQLSTLVPFPPDITQLYLDKIQLMIVAMFKGTFLLAILEGLAMGLVFIIAGVPYVFFLTILSMFLALLPMIGISLIAWPIGIILILSGQIWQGVFVIVAFVLVVANIDTVLRPRLVPKGAYLNPALVMLSVFGGLSLMGFIGIIYGPVIMILLVTSVEVYTKYIMRSDLEPFLAKDGSLDLEKMGLREKEEGEREKEGSTLNIMHRAAARVLGQGS